MKVYFGCSTKKILDYKDYYRLIIDTIIENGHELTRDWVDESIKLAENNIEENTGVRWYKTVMDSILASDVCIFDTSVNSMSVGHQLTFSLEKKKSVLLIAHTDARDVHNLFISGNRSVLLTIKNYSSKENLKEDIDKFLKDHTNKPKTRFHFILDKKQNDYLEWASYTYKKNKTDLLKKAINEMIDSDEKYSNN